jgi:hypothetical protein
VGLTAFDDGSEIEAGSMLKFPRRFHVPKPIAERVECETESSQQFSA